MKQHVWKDDALCLGIDTNVFFEKYEDDNNSRQIVDSLCIACPVARQCFAVGVSGKEWGVWGGVYVESGEISRELNKHKTKEDWSNIWKKLTID